MLEEAKIIEQYQYTVFITFLSLSYRMSLRRAKGTGRDTVLYPREESKVKQSIRTHHSSSQAWPTCQQNLGYYILVFLLLAFINFKRVVIIAYNCLVWCFPWHLCRYWSRKNWESRWSYATPLSHQKATKWRAIRKQRLQRLRPRNVALLHCVRVPSLIM